MNRPSPRPRPKPTATTQKTPSERLLGVADNAPTPARKRGRDRLVTFLDRTWDRYATHPQVGWELAQECLATPELLDLLRQQHTAEDAEVTK
jgi:hypothetical protein